MLRGEMIYEVLLFASIGFSLGARPRWQRVSLNRSGELLAGRPFVPGFAEADHYGEGGHHDGGRTQLFGDEAHGHGDRNPE